MESNVKQQLKIVIVGASGYAGGELFRLLENHPLVQISAITSEQYSGHTLFDAFSHFNNKDILFESLKDEVLLEKGELFFLALPHKESQRHVAALVNESKRVIDLSADYRLRKPKAYEKWYDTLHEFPELIKKAAYGLPELHRKKIKDAQVVANPGCYPTAAILALAPIIKSGFGDKDSIIIDSKSGISGAGRKPSQAFMYCEINESTMAYSIAKHRHTPEIEQELAAISKKKSIKITFTPHVVPMDRGILSTAYVKLKSKKVTLSEIHDIYSQFYKDEPFVRLLKPDNYPSTKAVKGSNFCDIALFLDSRTNRVIVVSAIDNLLKGASGQAVQNMNIMFGFPEVTGLEAYPNFP